MSTNPDEIRREIERTRAELSDNVNALGDSAKPSNMVREQVDQVKEGVHGFKERIFGSDTNPYDDGALGAVGDRAGTAVADAPRQVKASTRGNPLAAGLIAAGIGALIGGLIPASQMEKERATQLKDAAEPAIEELKALATEAKDNLQPLAEEAAGSIKEVAQGAAQNIKADAQAATDEVSEQARLSAERVKADAQAKADETKAEADRLRTT